MTPIRKFSLAVLFGMVIATGVWADERKEVHESIRGYTQGIIIASKKDNVEHMEPYATQRRAQKLYIWLKSWHENNYFMDSAIENIEFKFFQSDGKKATVTTRERWRYRYIQIVTKEVTQPWTSVEYTMHYDLLKEGKHWKVDEAKILSEKARVLEKPKR